MLWVPSFQFEMSFFINLFHQYHNLIGDKFMSGWLLPLLQYYCGKIVSVVQLCVAQKLRINLKLSIGNFRFLCTTIVKRLNCWSAEERKKKSNGMRTGEENEHFKSGSRIAHTLLAVNLSADTIYMTDIFLIFFTPFLQRHPHIYYTLCTCALSIITRFICVCSNTV